MRTREDNQGMYEMTLLAAALLSACAPGQAGQAGPAGKDGSSCSIEEVGGVKTLTCSDGSTFVLANGSDGQSATLTAEPAGPNCAHGGVRAQVGAGAPSFVCHGADGADGQSAVVTTEAAGSNCARGGVKVQVGASAPTYVCDGADGQSASITAEAAGPNCAEGGVKVQVGSGAPAYVCTGAAGSDGQSASVAAEPAGANCAAGGVKIQVGTGAIAYVCDGAAGASAAISVEGPGADCPFGGVKLQVGAGAPTFACNGANGSNALIASTAVTGDTQTITFDGADTIAGGIRTMRAFQIYETAALEVVSPTSPAAMYVGGAGSNAATNYCRPNDNTIAHYVVRTADGSEARWTSLKLGDDGNWPTAYIDFMAYKNGAQTGTERRMGDVPWGYPLTLTPYSFADPAFGDADAIVIAPRQADGLTGTPIGLDDIVVSTGCVNGGYEYRFGVDDGAGGGTAGNGVLEAGEERGRNTICKP